MRNIVSLLLTAIMFSFGTMASGQTNKFDLGVEGSPSYISLWGNEVISRFQETAFGFGGGAFLQYNFNQNFSLRTNIAFERKGSSFRAQSYDINGNLIGTVTRKENFDYLTMPLLIRATMGKKINYFVNTGPYFAYLLKQTTVNKGDNIPNTSTDNTLFFQPFDAGISLGLGISIPIKTKFAISFEARNNLGLFNISKGPIINNGSINTNASNFMLGLAYKLGEGN